MPASRDPEWESMVQKAVKETAESVLDAWASGNRGVGTYADASSLALLDGMVSAVQHRSGWQNADDALVASEYRMVLSESEPDIRIFCKIDGQGQVIVAYIEYQWGVSMGRYGERWPDFRAIAQHFVDRHKGSPAQGGQP